MKIDQIVLHSDNNNYQQNNIEDKSLAQIVLVFGDRFEFDKYDWYKEVRAIYPNASIISSTSSGNISDINFTDISIVVTAIYLEKTKYEINITNNQENDLSVQAGENLAKLFTRDDLCHLLVFSDGQNVNGSDLLKGLKAELPNNVVITGGLAGDSARFEKTLVGYNENLKDGNIVAIGFFGNTMKIGYGSKGGWDTFGPIRTITKSHNNVLYEFDNENALELYKLYLGDKAKELPSSSLLFPLGIFSEEYGQILVRTVLSIDEEKQSMTFAGDIPQGSKAQLMKANFENLVDGAAEAAKVAQSVEGDNNPQLALLVSCVGRKLVLGQRIEDELEAIQDVFGSNTILAGFYSYGELCPTNKGYSSDMQNQTMTITTFSEI